MIRICFIVDAAYPGGAERYIALLAKNLDRGLFNPLIFAKREAGLEPWIRELEKDDIEVHTAEMDLPFKPARIPSVIEKLRRVSPHIVHVNLPGPYDGQMGVLVPLSRMAGAARVVVTEHLPMVEKLWKRALLKKISYSWVDLVITVCKANVPFLEKRQEVPAGKIRVIYNALPLSYGMNRELIRSKVRKELNLKGDDVAVCITGKLIKRKGHGLLIEALSRLENLPWFLIIIGDGEEEGECRRKLKEGGMIDRSLFLGNVPNHVVERTLAGMDVLVMPSLLEAFPYAILEAMACSLPVIASDVYGIPEAVADGRNGLLFAPGDAGALERRLSQLILSTELRQRMGREGRRRFEERFTLRGHLHEMQTVYKKLLG